MKDLYAALAKAQSVMTGASKDAKNPHFKSSYATLQSVIDACGPALNENGFAIIQQVVSDEISNGVKTILAHESGDVVECTVPLLLGKNDMQGLGSAMTYARRYGLMCMAGIAPIDDDGNAAVASTPTGPSMNDAWVQHVKDTLPPNATAQQAAEAFAKQLTDQFNNWPKGRAAADNEWDRRKAVISKLEAFPSLHDEVVDSFENLKNRMDQ